MSNVRLSVVIPVYNNWWLTARCLRSLEQLRDSCSFAFETILVDNASSDETPQAVARFGWVRYVRHDENRNFAGACNAGTRFAQAPVTLLLNNDAYPLGDALTPLVAAFEREEVAIAGGALFFEDGVTQAAGLVVLRNAHWHYSCRNLPPSLEAVTTSRDALGVSGAAMAVRTDWFVRRGGFDESYVNGFEDVDLCLRAREEGRAIAYVADARFAHYEAASAGRFAREAENEQRFYGRWPAALASLPRTARGEVGAIEVRSPSQGNPLLAAALRDLEDALRAFGHPIVRGPIPFWRRLDRRFRSAGTIAWFTDLQTPPGIAIDGRGTGVAAIRAQGATSLEVQWLPCVAAERTASSRIARSEDPAFRVVGIAGGDPASGGVRLDRDGYSAVPITPEMLLGNAESRFACVVHLGLTDPSAFGNVLLAQAGIPAIVVARDELRALFACDVALFSEPDSLADCIARLVSDASARVRYGELVAADARRRFSPRRSAIRVVDLLCAARFGLERPAPPHGNSP
ncbi:MAG TPA: glycosyltransferase [Candidatus Cybelea sp.]|jgi:GT2 family glycosyltransferase|nr:glycosyltransferase [Candidatus Cybelea sp.]